MYTVLFVANKVLPLSLSLFSLSLSDQASRLELQAIIAKSNKQMLEKDSEWILFSGNMRYPAATQMDWNNNNWNNNNNNKWYNKFYTKTRSCWSYVFT